MSVGGEESFCRVLQPADPWINDCPEDERVANFSGGGSTSVAAVEICSPLRVLASFYGMRRGHVPLKGRYIDFTRSEAERQGGVLRSSDADPPWPDDYNRAHHEIVAGAEAVARYVARLFGDNRRDCSIVERDELLEEICRLFSLTDVHQKFEENTRKRLRRLFEQERELWDDLASRHPKLREDPQIKKALRRESARQDSE